MRILQVIPSMDERTGGPVQVLDGQSRGLAACGHEVEIATLEGPTSLLKDDFVMHVFRRTGPRKLSYSRDFSTWIQRRISSYSWIQLNSPYAFMNATAAKAAVASAVPYVFQPHGAFHPLSYDAHRIRNAAIEVAYHDKIISQASLLLWATEEEATNARPKTFGVPSITLQHGVDFGALDRSYSENMANTLRLKYGQNFILYLGRLHAQKRVHLLISAFASIAHRFPTASLVIAGPDHGAEAELRQLAVDTRMEGRIFFEGMVSGQMRATLLRSACASVLPSAAESFGVAPVESAGMGTPTILTAGVGSAHLLSPLGAATIVEAQADRIAATLGSILADPHRARETAMVAREMVRRNFDWLANARALADAMAGCVAVGE